VELLLETGYFGFIQMINLIISDVNEAKKYKAKDLIFTVDATNYRKRQLRLLKGSAALHCGYVDAMINMSRCVLKNV